ncbi:hypothetical protein FF38_05499 [Lucilia cuprina]|uniref:Uncharacterized protein n=1 Tax=Lucilia cuprina TaxID=7375 RepID=A0A0L0C4N8_LUCCU|nr:uncharacterized protein LOC111683245 [Lucilia cuprina]KAI8126393.1 hypothetical protein CVS40_3777 [Lucilia cuprina]KNC27250.1 hypothetical protein FF38_05499 [Lucilia cuprina]
MPANNVNTLVGATTRYIAGRHAMQTSYWRAAPGTSGKMVKYNKTCEFDRTQQMPKEIRIQRYNQNFHKIKHEI